VPSVVVLNASTGKRLSDIPVRVGTVPVPLLFGAGALWTFDSARQEVIRVDPGSGQRQERGISAIPDDLAVGRRYVWIGDGTDNELVPIDWQGRRELPPIHLPPPTAAPPFGQRYSTLSQVAFHAGTVWATAEGLNWPQAIVGYAEDTMRRQHLYRVSQSRQIGDVAAGPSGVWMENRVGGLDSGKAAIIQVAPTLGTPQSTSQGNYLPQGVAVGPDVVWFAGGLQRTIFRYTPSTRTWIPVITRRIITAIATGGNDVWAATSDPGVLYRLDPQTGRVTRTVPLGRYVTGIAVGGGRVYALLQRTPVTA
jgi:hypothetical protein